MSKWTLEKILACRSCGLTQEDFCQMNYFNKEEKDDFYKTVSNSDWYCCLNCSYQKRIACEYFEREVEVYDE